MATETTIPRLTTARLLLRPFLPADAPSVERLAGAAAVAATALGVPHPYPAGAAADWIATHAEAAAQGRAYTWAITGEAGGAVLGAITLWVAPRHARGALGYWLGVPHWGRGYMTAAARRVLAFGFGDRGLHRIEGQCLAHNTASARVLEKIGLRYEGRLRGYLRHRGRFEDLLTYARLATDADDDG